MGFGVTLLGGQPVPAHSFGIVLEDAPPVVVPDPEIELRSGVTLVGGQPVPAHSFGIVLEDAASVSVHAPEVYLGTGAALLGGQPVPAHSFGLVLRTPSPSAYMTPRLNCASAVLARRERGTLAPLWHSRHGYTLPQLRQMSAPPRLARRGSVASSAKATMPRRISRF